MICCENIVKILWTYHLSLFFQRFQGEGGVDGPPLPLSSSVPAISNALFSSQNSEACYFHSIVELRRFSPQVFFFFFCFFLLNVPFRKKSNFHDFSFPWLHSCLRGILVIFENQWYLNQFLVQDILVILQLLRVFWSFSWFYSVLFILQCD